MIQEIDPTQTKRAAAFSLWMHAPMPMITLFKTLDITPLVRYSRRTGCKFHMRCVGVLEEPPLKPKRFTCCRWTKIDPIRQTGHQHSGAHRRSRNQHL